MSIAIKTCMTIDFTPSIENIPERISKFWLVSGLFTRSDFKDPLLLTLKIGSCEHSKNDLPTRGSVILKKRMEIELALFSSDNLLER